MGKTCLKNNFLCIMKTNPPTTNDKSIQLLLTNVELWNVEYFSPF